MQCHYIVNATIENKKRLEKQVENNVKVKLVTKMQRNKSNGYILEHNQDEMLTPASQCRLSVPSPS